MNATLDDVLAALQALRDEAELTRRWMPVLATLLLFMVCALAARRG